MQSNKKGYVYIVTNKPNGSLYVGVTHNLAQRIWQHKEKCVKGHASRYNLNKLVYAEQYDSIEDAIVREKQLKFWKRAWKIRLILESNPNWDDIYNELI